MLVKMKIYETNGKKPVEEYTAPWRLMVADRGRCNSNVGG